MYLPEDIPLPEGQCMYLIPPGKMHLKLEEQK